MIDESCKILKSADDRILKSAADEVLIECGGCDLPDGDCVECVTFELFLDDTDNSDQDFFHLHGLGLDMGVWFDGGSWVVYPNFDESFSLVAVDPFETWQEFAFQFSKQDDGSVLCTWSVNGVDGPDFNLLEVGDGFTTADAAQFGAVTFGAPPKDGGSKHRSIRNIKLKKNNGFQYDFPPDFPPALLGSGVFIIDDTIRNDSDVVAESGYGSQGVSWDFVCCDCCSAGAVFCRNCTEITGVKVTYTISATSDISDPGDPNSCGPFNVSDSWEFTFTRIDWADPFTDSFQIKCYTARPGDGTRCQLVFGGGDRMNCVGGIRHDNIIDSVCIGSLDVMCPFTTSADEFCAGGTMGFNNRYGAFAERCRCGIPTDDGVVYHDCVSCSPGVESCEEGTPERCGGISCDVPSDAFENFGSWTPQDVSGIIGTFSAENTCTIDDEPNPGDHREMTLSVIVEVF